MQDQQVFFDEGVLELHSQWPSVKGNRKSRKAKRGNNQAREVVAFEKKAMVLKEVEPLTQTQATAFETFGYGHNVVLHGTAGTGKTFLSVYMAMSELINDPKKRKLVIIRSTVPSRDQGFLPGNDAEKAKIYEKPYHQIFSDLYGRSDAYQYMKNSKKVEFESTSYLRGTTFDNCVIIFDEFQNTTFSECDTVLTRIGKNCRVILSGDFKQSDLVFEKDKKGVHNIIAILKQMKGIEFIEFGVDDIVRSGFVKSYLTTKDRLGL